MGFFVHGCTHAAEHMDVRERRCDHDEHALGTSNTNDRDYLMLKKQIHETTI